MMVLKIPVTFLRDSAASQSVILEGVGKRSWLNCGGCNPQLPINGNDLAGGKVLLNPEITVVPLSEHSDDLELRFPEAFAVCSVTRAMSTRQKQGLPDEGEVELADSFMADSDCLALMAVVSLLATSPLVVTLVALAVSPSVDELSSEVCMSQEQLIIEHDKS